jgi:hypothetical protein
MALMFHRGLALPPPATPFLIAVLGIAVIIFAVGRLVRSLRTLLGRLSTS